MGDFVHLHVHSHYSLLDGLGKIDPLLKRTKELGMDALALTDHGTMHGVVEFYRAAREYDVKPIIGCEMYLAPNGHQNKRGKIDSNPRHLTVLARNNDGYKNLIKLTTEAHLKGYYYKPRIDYDLLEQHHQGLIILSGCLNGDISKAINEQRPDDAKRLIEWHLDLLGKDRFYLEVQDHPNIAEQGQLNDELFKYAKEYDLNVVATNDTHYILPEDAEAQDVLICVQTGKQVSDTDRLSMTDEDFSLKSPEEVSAAWQDHPEVVANSVKIAESCELELEFGVNRLPRFPLPQGVTPDEQLRQDCLEGIKERYPHTEKGAGASEKSPSKKEIMERLEYELGVITKTGYASYFLIVADFVNEAKDRGILVGPGRGSAAGSLVSYVLNITNIDPLHYNLLFERFLNPERISMPDIDLDFADDRRGEVIEYVRNKYGHEHVAQIITFGTMAARASIRDTGRALGFPYAFCDQVAKAIPPFANFEEALRKGSELKGLYDQDPQVKRLVDTARRLEGVCRHASTHAAGVVITDEPITEYVPLQLSTTADHDNETVTQYAMNDIEALGLLKMDFLGLKNLTIIQNTLNRIKERYDEDINIDAIPLNDQKAFALLQEGKSTGVFQFESAGMKRYLKELKPTELEDIISMVALYRPGPMDSIPDFIAAKHGRKKITYLHPILEPILEKTYGVIVTQDQVLEIAREFAGFSYAEADILRKAVGKKIKKLLDEQREKFISGAIEVKNIDRQTARRVWDFIEPFARYGFNRAHAACYAMIAYQTAYLKANYPAEFMAALLTSDEGNIDRAAIEVAEAISLDLAILPPDVNESDETFTVVTQDKKDAIRFGLGAIKNVGSNAVTGVIRERAQEGPFKDLADFFSRVPAQEINKKSVESLAKAGAFDAISERQQILDNMEKLLSFNRSLHKQTESGQQGLFGDMGSAPVPRLDLDPVSPVPKDERLAWEKELLGMYVSEHPMMEFQNDLQKAVTVLPEVGHLSPGQTIRVAGMVTKIKKIVTKSDQPMLFVAIEDMMGALEVVVFPSTLTKTAELWRDGAGLIIEGKLNDKDGESKLLADKVWQLSAENLQGLAKQRVSTDEPRRSAPTQGITIHLPTGASRETLAELKEVLGEHTTTSGVPVVLIIPQANKPARYTTEFQLPMTAGALTAIKRVVGEANVRLN